MIEFQAHRTSSPSPSRPPSFGLEAGAGWSSSALPLATSFDALISDQLGQGGLGSQALPPAQAKQASASSRVELPTPPQTASSASEQTPTARGPKETEDASEPTEKSETSATGTPPTDPALWAVWMRGASPPADKVKATSEALGHEVREGAHELSTMAGLPLDKARALGVQVKASAESAGTEPGFEHTLNEAQAGVEAESAAATASPSGREPVSAWSAGSDTLTTTAAEAPTEAFQGLETASLSELNNTAGTDGGQRPELAPFQDRLAEAMEGPLFRPALGTKISVMVKDGIEQAKLQLNPAEMGPVAIRLARDGQRVRVDFAADLALTRQTLEQAMPALAVALKEAGFTLSGGSVTAPQDTSSGLNAGHPGQQQQAQTDAQGSRDPKGSAAGSWRPESDTAGRDPRASSVSESPARPRSLGEVDLFA